MTPDDKHFWRYLDHFPADAQAKTVQAIARGERVEILRMFRDLDILIFLYVDNKWAAELLYLP